MTELAVNYSTALADLVTHHEAPLDLYKCPAWPDLIEDINGGGPVYVHFPLRAGMGTGTPINSETGAAPDWNVFETLLETTHTPWVSAHMGPQPEDHPGLSDEPWDTQVEVITEALTRDMTALVDRLGAEHVVGENIFEYYGMHLRAGVMPDVLTQVIESAGCGLLLDLSHARIAAHDLGVDPKAYVEALPVSHLREVHVTGIQRFEGKWVRMIEAAGLPDDQRRGRVVDHLPMTGDDWDFFAWAMDRIHTGAWRTPEIIAYEYGGVGPQFEAVTLKDELAEQVPRLYGMVHAGVPVTTGD